MQEMHLFCDVLQQGRDFLAERAVLGGAFTEGERHFLVRGIRREIGCEAFPNLVNEVVGAKGGARYILDVFSVAASVDAHAITHDMFHYVIMHGATKEQPRLVYYSLARSEAKRGEVFAAIGKSPGEVEVGRGLLAKGLLGRALHAQQGCCAQAHTKALVVAGLDVLNLLWIGVLG